jgi:hypothetical protein
MNNVSDVNAVLCEAAEPYRQQLLHQGQPL